MTAETEKFGLKSNPFHHLVTPEDEKIWAGLPEMKRILGDVVKSVHPDDIGASEFVVLASELGGGKTHALRYFANEIRNKKTGHAFYVSKTVRGEKNFFAEVLRSLVDVCGEKFFSDLKEKVSESAAKEAAKQSRYDQDKVKETAKSVFEPVNHPLIDALMGGNPMKFLKESCANDSSAATQMASLIRVMTTPIGEQSAPYPAAYLFLDEVEEVVAQKPAPQISFWSSCRELVNMVHGNFALILAFSEQTAVLEAAIPPYLAARMTRPPIEVEALDLDGAKQFIKDFLKAHRISEFNPPHPFHPFTEGAIDFMLDRETQGLFPRRIIMALGRVFKRGRAKLDGQEEFSKEIADEVLTEMGV